MVLNILQRLCFIALFSSPIYEIHSFRPEVDSNYSLDAIFSSLATTQAPDIGQNNHFQTEQQSFTIYIDHFELILFLCIFICIIYLLYKRRITIRSAIILLSNRFPRLIPLLFIAQLVQEFSRTEDTEQTNVHFNPEQESSSDVHLPHHLDAVESLEDVEQINSNRSSLNNINEELDMGETETWYDCRTHVLDIEEDELQYVVSNQPILLHAESRNVTCHVYEE